MRLDGTHWDSTVLHALGARTVADIHDLRGQVVGYVVEPPIDMTGYDAAAAATGISALLAYAAERRHAVETGGITVDGAPVDTDRESRAMMRGPIALATADPSAVINLKTRSGFLQVAAPAMREIGLAIDRHVEACFAVEADVATAIQSGAMTSRAQIYAAFATLAEA